MKKGTKIFVFATTMLLTVGALKATIGHRYGYGQMGGCHIERFHHRDGMEKCHKYNDTESNSEVIKTPDN